MWYLNYKPFENWAFVDKFLTAEECQQIKDLADNLNIVSGTIGNSGETNEDYRNSTIRWLDAKEKECKCSHQKLTDAINRVNQQFWNFDLDYIETLQYSEYHAPSGKYEGHMDITFGGLHNRKLSFSVQLDDSETYKGGDLQLLDGREFFDTKREQGTLIVFPSFLVHRVTLTKEGTRRSLVGWVCGPNFK
jgi:PKHD-type hydroxylase